MGKSKGFALVLVLVLLTTVTLVVVSAQPVKAQYQGDITINADGSITPSTAPIKQTDNTSL